MTVEYRPAHLSDLSEIGALGRAVVNELIRQGIPQWDERYPTEADFRRDIENGWLTAGVAEGQIAVVYALNRESDPDYRNGQWQCGDDYLVLHRICVHPAYQHRGLGRQTMLHIEAQAAAMGARSIRLDAFSQNPFSLRMYAGLGYKTVGSADWRMGHFYLLEKAIGASQTAPNRI